MENFEAMICLPFEMYFNLFCAHLNKKQISLNFFSNFTPRLS